MTSEEVAPPFESWSEHLKALDDRELTNLAGEYKWLDEEAKPHDQRAEFRRRREAIIIECERRGLSEAATACRPAA